MTYQDIIKLAEGAYESYTFQRNRYGDPFVKFKLKPDGDEQIFEVLKQVEAVVGNKRRFSHNKIRRTATFVLYNI